jgi:hypothetical protein
MIIARCPLCEISVISLRDEEPIAQVEAAVTEMNRSADESRNRSVTATRLKGKIETVTMRCFCAITPGINRMS